MKENLVCDGSELTFEEVRAEKYFSELKEKQKKEKLLKEGLRENNNPVQTFKSVFEMMHQDLERMSVVKPASALDPGPTPQIFGRPRPSNLLSSRRSLGLRLNTESTVSEPPQQQDPTGAADTTRLSSEVSHHPSVLADGSVHLPTLTPVAQPAVQCVDHRPASTSESCRPPGHDAAQ